MDYETLLVRHTDGIAVVTVNRPDKLNALNATAKRELGAVLKSLREAPDVAAVILTGAGEKAFVAGTDIEELTGLTVPSGTAFATGGQELFTMIEQLGKPVIAAVNGYALGGGCELALACTVRVASDRAKFGQPEVNLGIIPGYGGTQRLPRLIGRAKAMEMILTGSPIGAEEALRYGLVSFVVPPAELMSAAERLAQTFVAKSRTAIRYAIAAVNAAEDHTQGDGLRKEAELFGACCGTEDFREGTRAFLEKRTPVFKGS